jgi:hypothetical protein
MKEIKEKTKSDKRKWRKGKRGELRLRKKGRK